ncbi:classical arabinogalactan protein 25-like [Rosa sericea]
MFIIRMASFWFHIVLIMAFMVSPLLSFTSKASTITASPALFTTPHPSSVQGLPPDIAPLLPSPGPVVPNTPADNSIPTIPSNPSPPNPDESASLGPSSAFSPLPASSAASTDLFWTLNLAAFAGAAAYILVYAAS